MSKHHTGRVNKEHKVLVADINVSSKVSKLLYFCGCFFVFWLCGWISSSFVAADIHTHGANDFKGLLLTFSHVDVTVLFLFLFVSFFFRFIFMCYKLIYLTFIWFWRGSDFKSTHFRAKHKRTNKLYDTLQICTKQIGRSGVLCGIQCDKLCEYMWDGSV